jgi:hypothetical protein
MRRCIAPRRWDETACRWALGDLRVLRIVRYFS